MPGSDIDLTVPCNAPPGANYRMVPKAQQTRGERYAHRDAWAAVNGPVPPGLHVLHACDNPPCSEERHLFLGTPKDNAEDRERKGRHGTGGPRPGTANHFPAKLSDDAVREIRCSSASQRALAARYGVSQQLIHLVKKRARWAHVN